MRGAREDAAAATAGVADRIPAHVGVLARRARVVVRLARARARGEDLAGARARRRFLANAARGVRRLRADEALLALLRAARLALEGVLARGDVLLFGVLTVRRRRGSARAATEEEGRETEPTP